MIGNQQAKQQKEIEKQLKKQDEEYEKEKLECSICKRMVQRKCLDAHQKQQDVKRKNYSQINPQQHIFMRRMIYQTNRKHVMKM